MLMQPRAWRQVAAAAGPIDNRPMARPVGWWTRWTPADGRCRRLGPDDLETVDRALRADPVATVTLRSEIALGALREGRLLGVAAPGGRNLRAAVLTAPLLVPWIPNPADLSVVAEWLMPAAGSIQLMVGAQDTTAGLDAALRGHLPPPRLLRREQPLYVLEPRGLRAPAGWAPPVRRARADELDQLVRAGAAMHLEEVGFDPLAIDPVGFRSRVRHLIERGWAWVWTEDGRIVFKAECAAVTREAVQLQGVWVEPGGRDRGLGTRAMAALCTELLRDATERVSLFVNDFNRRAIHVYERVGFTPRGVFSSYLY